MNFSVKINLVEKHIKLIIEINTYKIYEQKQKKIQGCTYKKFYKKSTFKQETNLIYIQILKLSHMKHIYLFKN